jgi:anti-sigma regulatory factor (Ser/Thr protein kinase)
VVTDAAGVPVRRDLRRFPPQLDAPGTARAWCADLLVGWGLGDLAPDAVLVVSELATNAVLHGEGMITVAVELRDDDVLVEVSDLGVGQPEVRPVEYEDEPSGGRGLRIVEAVAAAWGVDAPPQGPTTVWAALLR